MNRKRVSFTIPAPMPETRAVVHPNWTSPDFWRKLQLHIDYLDRIAAGQKQSV